MTSVSCKKNHRKAFSPSEDFLLTRLVNLHGDKNWELISMFMNGRNARSCRERWRSFLNPEIINGPWSHEEDQLLVKLVREIGPKWKRISQEFKGRSECNLKNRWMRHLRQMIEKPLEPNSKDSISSIANSKTFLDFHDTDLNFFDDIISNKDFELW
ncbi:Myb-like DNA-binding domain containing protein [Histomonas meleagridis]|uniref:Myb-like DNA-binding domain containing protein n=1 Tax=Histomonas meleagridis TaxID=135588 RepID=UPI00355962E3|nr:Myb-like DNA-binding domain containing protein [Histomonas meleagridis]